MAMICLSSQNSKSIRMDGLAKTISVLLFSVVFAGCSASVRVSVNTESGASDGQKSGSTGSISSDGGSSTSTDGGSSTSTDGGSSTSTDGGSSTSTDGSSKSYVGMVGGSDFLSSAPEIALIATSDSYCAGVLVHPEVVVTIASCVENMALADISVYLDLIDASTFNSAEMIAASKVVLHPGYNSVTLDSNIAAISLSKAAASSFVSLPSDSSDYAIGAIQSGVSFVTGTSPELAGRLNSVSLVVGKSASGAIEGTYPASSSKGASAGHFAILYNKDGLATGMSFPASSKDGFSTSFLNLYLYSEWIKTITSGSSDSGSGGSSSSVSGGFSKSSK